MTCIKHCYTKIDLRMIFFVGVKFIHQSLTAPPSPLLMLNIPATVLGALNYFLVDMSSAKCQNGVLKNWFFVKVRSKELKFKPNLSCRDENFSNFWQISLVGVKIWYICSKWGSKELNQVVTGDLKNGRRAVKRGSWPLTYPYHLFRWVPPGLCWSWKFDLSQTLRIYLKNHWPTYRLVCTHFHVFFMLNLNAAMKIGILKSFADQCLHLMTTCR